MDTSAMARRNGLSILMARRRTAGSGRLREPEHSTGRHSRHRSTPQLKAEELRALASRGTIKTFRKRTVLLSEGDETDSFYIVLSGRVKSFVSDEHGKEIVLSTQGPSEYFGETLLDHGPRVASVMTLEPSRIAIVSKASFIELLLAHPEVAIKIMHNLARRVRSLTRKVKSLGLMDVSGRVVRLLNELSTMQRGVAVVERMSQQEIANRVGASREMISRVMKDLSARGYIRMVKKHIIIFKGHDGST